MRINVRSLAGFTLALAASIAWCQEPVERPRVSVGDAWTYATTEFSTLDPHEAPTPQKTGTERVEVTAASDQEIRVGRRIYTGEWNLKSSPPWSKYDPAQLTLRFPLKVGERHRETYHYRFDAMEKTEVVLVDIKAMRWEDVEVPAGKFRALLISVVGERHEVVKGEPGAEAGGFRRQLWYAPQAKRWVKRIDEGIRANGRVSHRAEEALTEYRLK